ncbi:MAG TPA: hypothetical protein VKC90_05965, partial [Chitinophagaceae bacterium]|nr:hypothetical protein [Chitinophagaceae bacterium]
MSQWNLLKETSFAIYSLVRVAGGDTSLASLHSQRRSSVHRPWRVIYRTPAGADISYTGQYQS